MLNENANGVSTVVRKYNWSSVSADTEKWKNWLLFVVSIGTAVAIVLNENPVCVAMPLDNALVDIG